MPKRSLELLDASGPVLDPENEKVWGLINSVTPIPLFKLAICYTCAWWQSIPPVVLKEDNVKVTISLKKSSIAFFKEEAKKQKTSYQKMIRELIDWYASRYQKGA